MKRLVCLLLPSVLLAGCTAGDELEPNVESVSQELFGSLNGIPDGMAVGGGEGYGDWLPAINVITSEAALVNAMANASNGDVLYLDDDTVFSFDLLVDATLELEAGVTLASGRGRNGSLGAVLRASNETSKTFIDVKGPGARITGLRIEGPSTTIAPPNDCGGEDATGIAVSTAFAGLEFDNNEIWGWPSSAIHGGGTQSLHVHDNHIHHNRRQLENSRIGCADYGLGYGVQVGDGAEATIEKNIFDYNRHDIASNGAADTRYTAQYNLVLGGGIGHSFDVHEDKTTPGLAGNYFSIHHNTFQQDHHASVRIRATPDVGAVVYDNEFMNQGCRGWPLSNDKASVQQRINGQYECTGFVNMDVFSNDENVDYLPAWFASFSGESFWSVRRLAAPGLSTVAFGEFDDEPGEDAFRAGQGFGFEISSSAREPWTSVTSSTIAFGDLRFGNFGSAPGEIGASKTDVIREYQGLWKVWINGDGASWQILNSNSMGSSLSYMRFADFDGDGVTDVFRRNDGNWRVSWGGQSNWQQLGWGYRSGGLDDLGFGEFDSNAGEDVIKLSGGSLYISSGGTTPWNYVQNLGVSMSEVRLADVDGDGITDLVKSAGGKWWVSWSGTSGWFSLNTSSFSMSELEFADLNGDGKDDFISRQTP